MIPVKQNKFGRYVSAVVSLTFDVYLEDNDQRDEIPEEYAKELTQGQLDIYAGSNDGSELLMNISNNKISFE